VTMRNIRQEAGPIHMPHNKEFVSTARITLEITTNHPEEARPFTWEGKGTSLFDGMAWETEVFWLLATTLQRDFGRGKSEIKDALQEVLNHLDLLEPEKK